jgi:hypothetical protein
MIKQVMFIAFCLLFSSFGLYASELDLAIPDLHAGTFHIFGGVITA